MDKYAYNKKVVTVDLTSFMCSRFPLNVLLRVFSDSSASL